MEKLKIDYRQILRAAKPRRKFWQITGAIAAVIMGIDVLYALVLGGALLSDGENRKIVIRENKIIQAVYQPQAIDDPVIREAAEKLRGFFEALDAHYPGEGENRLALKGYQMVYHNGITSELISRSRGAGSRGIAKAKRGVCFL